MCTSTQLVSFYSPNQQWQESVDGLFMKCLQWHFKKKRHRQAGESNQTEETQYRGRRQNKSESDFEKPNSRCAHGVSTGIASLAHTHVSRFPNRRHIWKGAVWTQVLPVQGECSAQRSWGWLTRWWRLCFLYSSGCLRRKSTFCRRQNGQSTLQSQEDAHYMLCREFLILNVPHRGGLGQWREEKNYQSRQCAHLSHRQGATDPSDGLVLPCHS